MRVKIVSEIGYLIRSHCLYKVYSIGRFCTKDALSVWTNLGKHFVVLLGYASLV